MIYGVDYDGTWTSDPVLWRAFVQSAVARGHQVILITNRISAAPWGPEVRAALSDVPVADIVFCGAAPKRAVARQRGWNVDVWVDDRPHTVDSGILGVGRAWQEPGVNDPRIR